MAKKGALRFEIVGEKELIKQFEKLEDDMRNAVVNNAIDKAGDAVMADAKANVPVDTGELRDSIEKTLRQGNKGGVVEVGSNIGSSAQAHGYYAFFVEYGTSKMPPKPYLRPALDKNKATATDLIKKEIESAVGRF